MFTRRIVSYSVALLATACSLVSRFDELSSESQEDVDGGTDVDADASDDSRDSGDSGVKIVDGSVTTLFCRGRDAKPDDECFDFDDDAASFGSFFSVVVTDGGLVEVREGGLSTPNLLWTQTAPNYDRAGAQAEHRANVAESARFHLSFDVAIPVREPGLGVNIAVVRLGATDGGGSARLRVGSDGTMSIQEDDRDGGYPQTVFAGAQRLSFERWNHIELTVDLQAQEYRLLINGSSGVAPLIRSRWADSGRPACALGIGFTPMDGGPGWAASFDNVVLNPTGD